MLRPGARIAVIAPSSAFPEARLEAGIQRVREWGYDLEVLPGARGRWRYLAGDDGTRIADLLAAFTADFDAVWMARGGYGLLRLLPALRLDGLRTPFLGFSDASVLLNPLADAGGMAIHAPVLTHLGDIANEPSREHLRRLLAGEPLEPLRGIPLFRGSAEGRLAGGNLCTIASACGTPWQLDARGKIVVLEDRGEAAYKVDRLLTQCLLAGAFDGAAAFALGEFEGADPDPGVGWGILDVFRERLGPLGVPVVVDLPIGHGPHNHAFPLVHARLEGGTLRW